MNPSLLPNSPIPFKPFRITTLLYEDLGAVEPGLSFALRLGSELGLDVGCPEYHDWLQAIDLPEKASDLLRGAQKSAYLVLSLRGDTELSASRADWLSCWAAEAIPGASALIVLFHPIHSDTHRAAAVRDQLEGIAAEHGIDAFFYDAEFATAAPQSGHAYELRVLEPEETLEAGFIGSVHCFSDARDRLLGVA